MTLNVSMKPQPQRGAYSFRGRFGRLTLLVNRAGNWRAGRAAKGMSAHGIAVAAAEMVATITGHPMPPPPDN